MAVMIEANAAGSRTATGRRPRPYFVALEGLVACRCFDMLSSKVCTEAIFGTTFIS